MTDALLPCPFCGGTKISTREGSTYRWLLIGCCGEVEVGKRDRTKPHDDPVNLPDAYAAWNTRAPLAHRERAQPVACQFCSATTKRCEAYDEAVQCDYYERRASGTPPAERAQGAQPVAVPRQQHVCGLQGYNGMLDPPCPVCEANRLRAATGEKP